MLIGGKAAPGYAMAKLIIKLINNVAEVVNNDPAVGDQLKVAFLPNYRVTAMELICPGTDLSEQISTAGKEASGTGNMKFMMNGAITIGTLDGANIEIREEVRRRELLPVRPDREEVEERAATTTRTADHPRRSRPRSGSCICCDAGISTCSSRVFSIRSCTRSTSPHDPWMTAADFRSFIDAQNLAAQAYQDRERWTRMSILNTATSGKFSTDRTIRSTTTKSGSCNSCRKCRWRNRHTPFQCPIPPSWGDLLPGYGMAGTISAGSIRASRQFIRQSRCGPVTRPLLPTVATTSPLRTRCPTRALISFKCMSVELRR